MPKEFVIKDLGQLSCFRRIEVSGRGFLLFSERMSQLTGTKNVYTLASWPPMDHWHRLEELIGNAVT